MMVHIRAFTQEPMHNKKPHYTQPPSIFLSRSFFLILPLSHYFLTQYDEIHLIGAPEYGLPAPSPPPRQSFF